MSLTSLLGATTTGITRPAKLFAAAIITTAGLGSAALVLSPLAAAEPAAPPAIPNVPALSILENFATNPASAAALLQSAASALSSASALAGAPTTIPVSPIPGTAGTPALGTTSTPGLGAPGLDTAMPTLPAPAASAPVTSPAMPAIALLNQLGVPTSLTDLTATGTSTTGQLANPALPATPAAPTSSDNPALGQLLPLSALP